jgi:hypothetical protein
MPAGQFPIVLVSNELIEESSMSYLAEPLSTLFANPRIRHWVRSKFKCYVLDPGVQIVLLVF